MAGKASFNWIDPLLLDQQLTEEERMVRDSAEQFAQDKLAPRVLEAFRHEKTDPAIFREMGEIGLLGATIPEQYGGSGLNYVCYGLIAREVERVDSGYRSMMSVQSSLVMVPINEFGTEAQKQKYLPIVLGVLAQRVLGARVRFAVDVLPFWTNVTCVILRVDRCLHNVEYRVRNVA